LLLNHHELSTEPHPEEAHEKDLFQSRAALAVQSVLRMVLEGSWPCSSMTDMHLELVPIWSIYPAYRAALLCSELGSVGGDEEKWRTNLNGLRHTLKTLEPRWKLAGIRCIHLFEGSL
jgi:hypothetical protein